MDEKGFTALHLAVYNREYEKVLILGLRGANVNLGIDGKTPLYYAVRRECMDISKLLLAANAAKVDYVFPSGKTLLHLAVEMKNINYARRILDQGVDVNASTEDGFTALHNAICESNYDDVVLLIARGADINAKCGPQVCIL